MTIPIVALLAERGRRRALIGVDAGDHGLFGLVMAPMFDRGHDRRHADDGDRTGADGADLRSARHRAVGAVPDAVRYTGSSLTFNLAGIFGASLAPYIATWLATNYGLQYVGYYLTAAAALSLAGLLATRETKDDDLHH